MKRILAIDPGPIRSSFVIWNGAICFAGDKTNEEMRLFIGRCADKFDMIAIEMIACYGMAVGAETFETCRWIGRFEERYAQSHAPEKEFETVYRKDVKIHLCGSVKAKDSNIRQALIDKHGKQGTKKNPGPLYGITGHKLAALAVADYVADKLTL